MHASFSSSPSSFSSTFLLLSVSGVGVSRYWQLLDAFGSAEAVLQAPFAALADGLGDELAQALDAIRQNSGHPAHRELARTLDWCETHAVHVLTHNDPAYPQLLNETHRAPPYLFVKGNIETLHQPQVAIVGSRSSSQNGKTQARAMAAQLVAQGFTVTSGLALGIDSEAHRGALQAKGHTVAVVGTGIDRVYPQRNHSLAQAIVDGGGAMVSEFPLGTVAAPGNFPRRNRIISGLSLGTLVIEAAVRSGSLITARYALEQNREVFAMPGAVGNVLSRGCHALIKQGAVLVENAEDICAELGRPTPLALNEKNEGCAEAVPQGTAVLSAVETHVMALLEDTPQSLDVLADRCDVGVDQLLAALIALEITGKAHSENGGYVLAVNPTQC